MENAGRDQETAQCVDVGSVSVSGPTWVNTDLVGKLKAFMKTVNMAKK